MENQIKNVCALLKMRCGNDVDINKFGATFKSVDALMVEDVVGILNCFFVNSKEMVKKMVFGVCVIDFNKGRWRDGQIDIIKLNEYVRRQ